MPKKQKKTVKKPVKKNNKKKESFGLTSEQPTVLYSRDLSSTFTSPDDNTITFVSTKESVMPSHEITTPSGVTSLSGREKRAMVVQYYANMQPTRLKKNRKHSVKKPNVKKHTTRKNTNKKHTNRKHKK
uniref:Uncharacterized protein n=1 Tax=viral metagenome TaxID=1070528 RepID=A0A6C0E786_9ZZZZ